MSERPDRCSLSRSPMDNEIWRKLTNVASALSPNDQEVNGQGKLAKVAESFISKWLMQDIRSSLDPQQYGGLKGRSTTHYLVSLMDHLCRESEKPGNITTLIMTDFSKAFDRIDHTVAISKLIKLGARPSIIPWISDFVSNRRQRVRYGGQLSEWEILTCSVPQGTLLGPILFLAVFDDAVRDAAPSIHEWKYVDDLTMTESRHRLERSIMQEELDKFGQWSKDNYVLLNGDKCKIMTICFLRIPPAPPSLNIYGSELESVAVACLLGVWLQANLKWETNVTKMLNKANGRLFLLRRLKHFNLPVNDLLQVYKSYVRPVVEYCAPVWHPGLTSSQSARLERIQKRALRTILRGQYVDYNSALHTTGLQSLSSRRTDLCRKFASKINPDLLPPRGSEEHGRNTRNANKLRTVKCRTKMKCALHSRLVSVGCQRSRLTAATHRPLLSASRGKR
ncbi:hypothetical protein Bbelb_082520 [Branchiostoma belcheri]|nr:hypothetical protein Bbelb_082520 [Branchiostoma belcheri]